jgi:hypothetical protein
MHNPALTAERNMLSVRLVPTSLVGVDWVCLRRKGLHIRTKLLRYLHQHTTGKFAMGHKYIAFEKEEDAIMYKIAYPR